MIAINWKIRLLKSMSKVVALIARIVVFSLIFNESSFSLLISILSTEHYNLCRKKLEKWFFFRLKMKMKNFELIEKCSKTRRVWYQENPLSFVISNMYNFRYKFAKTKRGAQKCGHDWTKCSFCLLRNVMSTNVLLL